ncbi:hypothetical protein TRFO_32951 [Tritrichomonas foetus]|uniref:Uncharacterized protein n=1 Tax=Tritrichomonas foetus TaxID=1144522 RepID=A0A1J4JMR0_9EUKA|nr:hypothetical protein TRFO_32951 [Tritrichomonas foetus]|eukprot:OHT00409.1 hypothetical protein TRFO_32951 [Tritrichomonas foetus]
MDIEDDFIEDSTQAEESDDENDFFLTATMADEPKEIVLKPAVNVYPLTSLTQQLLSKMYSLQNFGSSSIGATVPGSVFDLAKHLIKMRNSFPTFVKESNVYSNSKQYAMQKKLNRLKDKIEKTQQDNRKLKERVRNNKRRLPDLTKNKNDEFTESEKIKAEMKSNVFSLKKAVSKLKEMNQLNDQMQCENETIQKQINDLFSKFKHSCTGEDGQINRNIVKVDIELRNNIQKHKENLAVAQEIVDSYKVPIQALEQRLADMDRRISAVIRPPFSRISKLQKIRV